MSNEKNWMIGQRAQLPPWSDRWMMGDRYGTITKVTKDGKIWIYLDKSGRTAKFYAKDCEVFRAV
jgi:hypothetical protein